jgi:hypothetical protein
MSNDEIAKKINYKKKLQGKKLKSIQVNSTNLLLGIWD